MGLHDIRTVQRGHIDGQEGPRHESNGVKSQQAKLWTQ